MAGAIAIVAFTALSLFLGSYAGTRALERAQAAAQSGSSAVPAVLAYFYQQSTPILPCPDRTSPPDGTAEATCDGSGGNNRSGVLPWASLGLSREDAIDSNGNYYRYVVSGVARNVCESITNDYDSDESEFTGTQINITDLELLLTTQSAGEGRDVPFAIISHGPNGYGSISQSGTVQQAPPSAHTFEDNNDNVNPTVIYTGPRAENDENAFDDQVVAPSVEDMRAVCESLTPGEALNADVTENFDNGSSSVDTSKMEANNVTVTSDGSGTANRVANFSDNTSYLWALVGHNFQPEAQPLYISTIWTPNAGATARDHAGISIATRATLADKDTNQDTFSGSGITFRFYTTGGNNISGGGVANNIHIIEDDGPISVTSAGTYDLINGERYLLEVYDNGDDVWMRITQVDDLTNTATVSASTTDDLAGEQRIFFINDTETAGTPAGASVSFLDDIVIGRPMLALETDGAGDYVASTTAVNGTSTGDLTLEAWFRPLSLPVSGATTIVSQWNTADTDTSSFRLFMDGTDNGRLTLQIAGTDGSDPVVDRFDLGIRPTAGEWSHVAVTYDSAEQDMRFYLNGVFARRASGTLATASGIRAAAQRFAVGADSIGGTPANFFHGNVSDVRVWDDVRTADEISANFQRRLAFNAAPSNLVVNWRFDNESGTPGSNENVVVTPAVGGSENGVFAGNAIYVPVLSIYFRPFSTSFCPNGTIVNAYHCDFHTLAASGAAGSMNSITVPTNLPAVFAKVWGAGGGAYDNSTDVSPGGSGGFSEGLIRHVDGGTTSIAGQGLNIYVGGFGANSGSDKAGAGGGGGSGVFRTNMAADPILVAGGGGGASFNDTSGNCPSLVDTANQCGLGGPGGGVGAAAGASDAPDDGGSCGGRGGASAPFGADDGSDPPPTSGGGLCDDGGGNNSGQLGGPQSGTHTGGAGGGFASFIAGGQGYHADDADGSSSANAIGGGGGGGGAAGGEAGGYDDNSNYVGFGGGGGSGLATSMAVINPSGAAASYNASTGTACSDSATVTATAGVNVLTSISPAVSTLDWQVGCILDDQAGNPNILAGTSTILSIDTASNTVTVAGNVPQSGTDIVNSSGSGTTSISTSPGGNDDADYSPSYLDGTTYINPGVGGTSSGTSGRAGALVLKW